MARPRRGKRRREARDWLTEYLVTGIEPDDPELNPFEVLTMCYEGPARKAAWAERGSRIMRDWSRSGCRPFAWWIYDAPRLPVGTFPGCFWDGLLPEPRRHLGGPGRPLHEVTAHAPAQDFGIWNWYGDPAHPPRFESQFDYLKRHGLLMPGEDEFIPEPQPHPEHIEDSARWEAVRAIMKKDTCHE